MAWDYTNELYSFAPDLNELNNFEDIHEYCSRYLTDYYSNRILELYNLVMEEEDDQAFCLSSLKCLVYFVKTINNLKTSSITVFDGLFYLEGFINKQEYTFRFKSDGEVDYVVRIVKLKQYTSTLYDLLDNLNKVTYD
jgi:hypothetical protein